MLVAAMNPTPGGDFATDETSQREMDKYLSRISGPLVDRMDIHVEVPRVPYKQLAGEPNGTTTAEMRRQVMTARRVAAERNGGPLNVNATLSGRQLDKLAVLDDAGKEMLRQADDRHGPERPGVRQGPPRRPHHRRPRSQRRKVACHHVAEAIQYRLLDRKM
jgi:magnesium chelatase family protein